MLDTGKWQDILKTVKHFADSGDERKVLAILENALENYPQQEAQTWFMFYKAFALLKLKGLEAARDLAMDVLDPDNPIEDSAKAMLRGRVLDRMSEANDVEGLARLLPDQLSLLPDPLSRDIHALHRQALRIQRDHGLVPDSEPITLGETPPSQLVLSERKNISYRIPAKTHYSTQIKSFLDGKRSYTPAVKTYTLTNCTRISWSCYHFFFDAAGGLIRECSDLLPVLPNGKLPVSLNDNLKDLLKETPPAIPGVSAYICDIFAGPNYCHWILDWLPRLSLCERAAPFDNIFCQRVECDFMRQSLAFLGYQDKTIIAGGDSACVRRFETLLVPDNTTQRNLDHPMQLCHPDLLQWWRSRLSARKPHPETLHPARELPCCSQRDGSYQSA